MKSLANSLLNIAIGVCEDVRLAYPQYAGGLSRDIERLTRNCQTRGLGFFSLDLPSLDTALIRGLEVGRLVVEGPLSHAVSDKVKVPRLFSGLWLRVFDSNACLREDADVNAIFFLRQLCCLGKKVQTECSPARHNKAIGEYHDIERSARPPSLQWAADELDPNNRGHAVHLCDGMDSGLPLFPTADADGEYEDRILLEGCQRVADFLSRALGFFEPVTYSGDRYAETGKSGFRHGRGAVADRRGKVNKYDFPRWSSKLEEWFPYRTVGTIASDTESNPINHEVASRLMAVPKTAKAPRLIASEPTEHQWCQQLTWTFMRDKLAALLGTEFICFRKQELSQAMVLKASLDRSLATIDLSSASDRLTCWTVERVFRRNPSVLHALHAARTRYIRYDDEYMSSFIKLKKFASQGTAVTFPVQSFVFLCIALGVCINGDVTWQKIGRLRHHVRVFGDDIIVPNTRYAAATRALTLLGLKVNEEKSFHVGYFRESCGMDAFKGFDITPVKPVHVVADGPTSRKALLDTTNNLFKKGLWNASRALESTLGNRILQRLPIVGRDSGIVGRTSFVGSSLRHLDKRWNNLLHRTEYRTWTFRSKAERDRTDERFALHQYFTEAPTPDVVWRHGIAKRSKSSDGLRWEPLYGCSEHTELRRAGHEMEPRRTHALFI